MTISFLVGWICLYRCTGKIISWKDRHHHLEGIFFGPFLTIFVLRQFVLIDSYAFEMSIWFAATLQLSHHAIANVVSAKYLIVYFCTTIFFGVLLGNYNYIAIFHF
jgi:hypothetical protein